MAAAAAGDCELTDVIAAGEHASRSRCGSVLEAGAAAVRPRERRRCSRCGESEGGAAGGCCGRRGRGSTAGSVTAAGGAATGTAGGWRNRRDRASQPRSRGSPAASSWTGDEGSSASSDDGVVSTGVLASRRWVPSETPRAMIDDASNATRGCDAALSGRLIAVAAGKAAGARGLVAGADIGFARKPFAATLRSRARRRLARCCRRRDRSSARRLRRCVPEPPPAVPIDASSGLLLRTLQATPRQHLPSPTRAAECRWEHGLAAFLRHSAPRDVHPTGAAAGRTIVSCAAPRACGGPMPLPGSPRRPSAVRAESSEPARPLVACCPAAVGDLNRRDGRAIALGNRTDGLTARYAMSDERAALLRKSLIGV